MRFDTTAATTSEDVNVWTATSRTQIRRGVRRSADSTNTGTFRSRVDDPRDGVSKRTESDSLSQIKHLQIHQAVEVLRQRTECSIIEIERELCEIYQLRQTVWQQLEWTAAEICILEILEFLNILRNVTHIKSSWLTPSCKLTKLAMTGESLVITLSPRDSFCNPVRPQNDFGGSLM